MEAQLFSLIRLLILHLHLHLHLHSLYLAAVFTHTRFNHKLDLDTHSTTCCYLSQTLAAQPLPSFNTKMASGSTMAAVNVSDSRDSSLTTPPHERNTTGKGAQRRTRQGCPAKNLPSLLTGANKRIYNAIAQLVPDSQLLKKVSSGACVLWSITETCWSRQDNSHLSFN